MPCGSVSGGNSPGIRTAHTATLRTGNRTGDAETFEKI